MSKEIYRFLSQWLLNKEDEPEEGLRAEIHSHSHYSDGEDLGLIIKYLMDNDIYLWSLTDHDNSDGFDELASGLYNLNTISGHQYDLELSLDGRYMVISRDDNKELVLLRSIEKMTDAGEIGIHGYSGDIFGDVTDPVEVAKRAVMAGAFVVINHPFYWEGVGYEGEETVRKIVDIVSEMGGVVAVEKNSTEIPPQVYSPVRAEILAKESGIPLVSSGDAHWLYMYGKTGLVFDEEVYRKLLEENDGNHADTVRELIKRKEFTNYLNYLTLGEFLEFSTF